MDASQLPRFDSLQLAIRLGGNKKTIHDMQELYLKTAMTSLVKLEKALATNDTQQWLQVLHQLKGASKNIAARRLAEMCAEAEEIQELPHDYSTAMIFHLYKEFAMLSEILKKEIDAFSA